MKRRQFLHLGTALGLGAVPVCRIFAKQAMTGVQTGFNFNRIYLEHQLSPDHPESPRRLDVIMHSMEESGLLDELVRVGNSIDAFPWIYQIHTKEHVNSIKTHYAHSHDVALAVVSGVLTTVDQVCAGKLKNAFCATRPPGHHALNTGREEGFCFYNAVAIAARYAQQQYDLRKILIVDWDYHHGNATEAAFYNDPGVLYFSTHDFHAYPGTGDPAKTGTGAGKGYNINVHLPCGTTDGDIISVFEKILVPAAGKFNPDLILISAGFDSRKDDLLGCFEITDAGFVELTRIVMSLADEFCAGRIVSVLEGGYNVAGNASAVVHHVRTLALRPK